MKNSITATISTTGILIVRAMLRVLFGLCLCVQAYADTSQFRGVNWAMPGDNFTTGRLVIEGLNVNDSYSTVYQKASAVYQGMEATMAINTVRLPINTVTIADGWWNNYRAAIDAATDRGFKVILAYWEDGAASGGRITNTAAWNTMWSAVTYAYGNNNLVYFEPMNEPHGYNSSEWRDVAANWLSYHYSAQPDHVLIDGIGYAQDVTDLCNDSRFSNTLLALHHYTFFYGEKDYWGWRNHFEARQSSCYDRVVVTEFGAAMATGLNYMTTDYSDNFVAYLRALTGSMHDRRIGSVYWPALGGKLVEGRSFDYYSMFGLSGSNTDLCLNFRNQSGAQRVMFGWGDDNPVLGSSCENTGAIISGQAYYIQNRNSGKCLRTLNNSTANAASVVQYTCGTSDVEKWRVYDIGNNQYSIVQVASGKYADISGASTANGGNNIIWPGNGGNNQKWRIEPQGDGYSHIVNVNSNLLLDISGASTADNGNNIQWPNNGGYNQDWVFISVN